MIGLCVSLPLSSLGGPGGARMPGGGYLGLARGEKAPGMPNRLAAPGKCNRGAHGGRGAKWAAAAAYSCSGGGSTPDSSTMPPKRCTFTFNKQSLRPQCSSTSAACWPIFYASFSTIGASSSGTASRRFECRLTSLTGTCVDRSFDGSSGPSTAALVLRRIWLIR